jgi:hypothetical protein
MAFCAKSQANATCAGVAFFCVAIVLVVLPLPDLLSGFPLEAGQGVAEIAFIKLSAFIYFPCKKPLPRGLNGTKPMPNSSSVGIISSSVFCATKSTRFAKLLLVVLHVPF